MRDRASASQEPVAKKPQKPSKKEKPSKVQKPKKPSPKADRVEPSPNVDTVMPSTPVSQKKKPELQEIAEEGTGTDTDPDA